MLLSRMDKVSEAEAEYRKAIALLQKLADDYPAVTQFRNELAGSLNNLGILVGLGGRVPQGDGASCRRWLTTTPPSPNSATSWH